MIFEVSEKKVRHRIHCFC